MKSVIKVFIYVFISFCIADTIASNYLGMQLTLLVSLLASMNKNFYSKIQYTGNKKRKERIISNTKSSILPEAM